MKQTNKYTYEAALDLGASPLYAFFKVVFPDIFPGVCSGFLLAFTMSLDDFVITHFTKGPGIDTLSTKIYTEVKKGIKPHEILLVVDSMTGQEAVNVAQTFNEMLEITGVILTKLDGDTRGGAALSVRYITGKPIKFIGVGEGIDDLQRFNGNEFIEAFFEG